ncbi:hypothetical protein [Aquimarina sp. AU474]|uniref:hypothetical protein n=1 Tax=Aquimarina sp. AU474 TaxID=2108529 RepID=UPI000D69687F|nr:hypothetical protein [Aquimarina sp. AU474]
MKQLLYTLILSLIFVSCNSSNEPKDFDKDSVKESVLLMFDNYHYDIKKEGLTAEFKYLDSSDDFFWVPPRFTSALSYDSVKHILEKNAKAYQTVSFDWDTITIFPLTQDIANFSGIVNSHMIDTSGVSSKFKIIESGTLIKRKSGWKLLNGQSAILDTAQ